MKTPQKKPLSYEKCKIATSGRSANLAAAIVLKDRNNAYK